MVPSIMVFHIWLTADFLKDSGKVLCFVPAALTLEHAVLFTKFFG